MIITNGGPGPYCISYRFVDTSTIKVRLSDSSQTPLWNWISEINGILFTTPLDSGTHVRIRFSTDYYGLPKIFSLYTKRCYTPPDSNLDSTVLVGRKLSFSQSDLLQVSGYKSVGVSIGTFGQVNIEQGLDISVRGEIRPGTELNAHLSDEGSTLQGATKEISDFDMMYIALKDQLFDITAGDQYVNWLSGGILGGQKKIKGLSAMVHQKNWYAGGFGALSGGKYAVEYIGITSGIQGPYSFTGNGEQGFISPVQGTIKCYLNGKLLEEGEEQDYIIDYDFGSITFTSQNLLINSDVVKLEYEYKLYDYQRMIAGSSMGYSSPDSLFSVRGAFWSESDNKDRPVDQTLTTADMAVLKNAGDKPPQSGMINADALHPNDVPRDDALYPLYKMSLDASGNSVFTHVRFNRLTPDSSKGFYRVWFSKAEAGRGEYQRTWSSYYNEYIYSFAGGGGGSFSPRAPLTPPVRKTAGELFFQLNHSLLKADISIAGKEFDKNIFSSIDDNDNLGSSERIAILAGKKRYDEQSVWLNGTFTASSRHFEGELLSVWDKLKKWNDSSSINTPHQQVLWEAGSGATFIPGVTTQLTYGQSRNNRTVITDKVNNVTNLHFNNLLKVDYDGTQFRHNPFTKSYFSRSQSVTSGVTLKDHLLAVTLKEKWITDSTRYGSGLIGAGADYMFIPLTLREELMFDKMKNGSTGLLSAKNYGYQLIWNQSVKPAVSSLWDLDGSTRYFRQSLTDKSTLSTFLINVKSDVRTRSDVFTTRQEYQSNSERSTSLITVPVYAGKGLGTHIYDTTRSLGDTTLARFIPHIPGDWIIEQREIADNQSSSRMRKTRLSVTWTLQPLENMQGILADLVWDGNLFCEEYSDAEYNQFSAWIPGVQSLKYSRRNIWSPYIRYADCSYHQEIDWTHPENEKISANFSVTPSLKQIQSYRETSVDLALSVNYIAKNSRLINKANYLSMFHNDSAYRDYNLLNLGAEFLQKLELKQLLSVYIQEHVGVGDESDIQTQKRKLTIKDHYYCQINPGVQYRPLGQGWVDVSYTFSYVALPGDFDYRIARGFSTGVAHVISVVADFRIGKYFSVKGMYRGEIKPATSVLTKKNDHIFSFEMKAFL